MNRFFFSILGLVLFSFVAAVLVSVLLKDSSAEGLELDGEANRYHALEFEPRYRSHDCVVQFDLLPKNQDADYMSDLNGIVRKYLFEHEPKAVWTIPMHLGLIGDAIRYQIQFSDQCERRFEIMEALSTYSDKQFGGKFSISINPDTTIPGQPGPYWIDSPDYDPEYWANRKKALRGDGKALLYMAESLDPTDTIMRYTYLILAVEYLRDGSAKQIARRKSDHLWSTFHAQQKDRATETLSSWRQGIARYHFEPR